MRAIILGAALTCGLLAAVPAAAADVTTITCVSQALPSDLVTRVRDSSIALARDEPTVFPADAQGAITAAALDCQRRNGWSDAARDAAVDWTKVQVGYPALTQYALSKGYDVERLAASLKAMTETERSKLLERDDAGILALLRELMKRGFDPSATDSARLSGVLSVAILRTERDRADFVSN